MSAASRDRSARRGANGDFLRAKVLSRGSTDDASRLFALFYGGPPQTGPLLKELGLAVDTPK